jgi:DNA (cytosine-5)-methyltransferase 1
MLFLGREDWQFQEEKIGCYRRLSIRECARIQTFPDTFHFIYADIKDGYRMIGNAVPPLMAKMLAESIVAALDNKELCYKVVKKEQFNSCVLVGLYKNKDQYANILRNLLYYVRSDNRKGSIFKENCDIVPRYLLLHNKKTAALYELTEDESILVDSTYLSHLGFNVSGQKYLCFKMKDSRPLAIDGCDETQFSGSVNLNKLAPYFTDIKDILKFKQYNAFKLKTNTNMPRFIDLFAGLGGFHFALEELGCECVFASEIKEDLQKLYHINFPDCNIQGDITKIDPAEIPAHEILCAGFPCQPFSQAGKRQGFEDEKERGNLFNNICNILRVHRPRYVILENVSNLKGHDNGNTWKTIYHRLSDPIEEGGLNYEVKNEILSPHQFGLPQHRRRIYIVCENRDFGCLEHFKFPAPNNRPCDITRMIREDDTDYIPLKDDTRNQLHVWQQFIDLCVAHNEPIPSFPIWVMEWGATYEYKKDAPAFQKVNQLNVCLGKLGQRIKGTTIEECLTYLPVYAQTNRSHEFPQWKKKYIQQNREFYNKNKEWLMPWIETIKDFENSHLKMEWNCGPKATPTLRDKIIQFRASGIRVKLATFSPALNLVGTQIPIFPWVKLPATKVKAGEPVDGRYMSRYEAALIQGMRKLKFGDENFQLSTPRSYAALGNAVNVTIVKHIARELLCQ